MPRKPLLMMAILMLIFSWTIVASSLMVIWKPPSPTTTQTSASGLANFAPMAAGSAKPRVMVARHYARRKFFEDFARVADKSGVHLYVLVDFCAIDLDVNFARGLCVGAKVAGDAIVEAHADGDEQVRFLNGIVDPSFAVHAHHAEIQRVAGREAADTEKSHGDGIVPSADKLFEGAHRTGNHDAVSGEDQRAFR